MLPFIFIFVMILMYTAQSLFCKLYSAKYPGEESVSSSVFSIVVGLTIALSGFVVSGFQFTPDALTWLFGVLNAAVIIGYNLCMVGASVKGPYSVQMVCMLSGGILVPTFISLFFGDTLSWGKWIAVAVIILSLVMVNHKKDDQKVQSKAFYVYCAGLFLLNGVYGTLLDVQQRLTGADDKEEMIILTYLISALASAMFLLFKRKKDFLGDFKQTKLSLTYLLVCTLASTAAIHLLIYIIPLINITVLYTFDNAGVLLFSVLASCLFFREKLSKINLVGCGLMTIGLMAISLL